MVASSPGGEGPGERKRELDIAMHPMTMTSMPYNLRCILKCVQHEDVVLLFKEVAKFN